jgi:signal peptidase
LVEGEEKEEKGENRGLRKEVLRSLLIIGAAILIFAAAFQVVKFATGTSTPLLVVVSESMEPAIKKGDLILIAHTDPVKLKVDDVIVFHNAMCLDVRQWFIFREESDLCVHRIYERINQSGVLTFRTKGDNNPGPDPWIVTPDQIEGRVVAPPIPYIGTISMILQPPLNYMLIVCLILLIILTDLWPDIKERIEGGRETSEEPVQPSEENH